MAIYDQNPVTDKHLLIVPKRHVADYFSLTLEEKCDMDRLLRICKEGIARKDNSVTGFNIGINCGKSAGQTIFHCHVHLIPRRDGDTPSPRGGVRGVIPKKRSYPMEIVNDPRYYGLPPRTKLKQYGDTTIAIVLDRKSRIIMADGKKLLEKAALIKEKKPDVAVALVTTAPVCSKTKILLTENNIAVHEM